MFITLPFLLGLCAHIVHAWIVTGKIWADLQALGLRVFQFIGEEDEEDDEHVAVSSAEAALPVFAVSSATQAGPTGKGRARVYPWGHVDGESLQFLRS